MLYRVLFAQKSGFVFQADFVPRQIATDCFTAVCASDDTAEAVLVGEEGDTLAAYVTAENRYLKYPLFA